MGQAYCHRTGIACDHRTCCVGDCKGRFSGHQVFRARGHSKRLCNSFADAHRDSDSGTAALQDGEQATADGIVDAEGRVRIPACASADLTVRPTISGGEVGQARNISVAIENRAGVACSFEFGHIDFKISSGDETVYDGSKCQRDRESATLLLIPGDTWNGGLTWDGGLYSGCDAKDRNSDGATDPAPAGTYRLQLLLNGQTVGDERVFTLTQPVQPTTEATPEPSQSSTSEATSAPQGEEGH